MIFREVIDQILFERGLDYKELATELGVSLLQIKNLHTGITKQPSDRIYNKLLKYCEEYNIEIDINWNDVLYEIFQNSRLCQEYKWISDMQEDGYVVLKHQKCGKKTLVPKSAFESDDIVCIHCWIDKYTCLNKDPILSEYDDIFYTFDDLSGQNDAYLYKLSETDYKHEFIHKCGHTYSVTYEDIKKRKFKCPVCSGYKYNTENLKGNSRNDSDIETNISIENDSSYWTMEMKENAEKIAKENCFYIEEKDTLYSRFHYPEMTTNQFLIVCEKCFEGCVIEKDGNYEFVMRRFIETHVSQCEQEDDCLIENTKCRKMVWIPDVEKIIRIVSPNWNEHPSFEGMLDDFSVKEVYIANISKNESEDATYLLYHMVNDDESNSINFFASVVPGDFARMNLRCYPKDYSNHLYDEIILTLNNSSINHVQLRNTCDDYVEIVNYLIENHPPILAMSSFWKTTDSLNEMWGNKVVLDLESNVKKILSMQRCPVCKRLYRSDAKSCACCGFEELNKVFINKDEYELWFNDVVLPARQRRESNE